MQKSDENAGFFGRVRNFLNSIIAEQAAAGTSGMTDRVGVKIVHNIIQI